MNTPDQCPLDLALKQVGDRWSLIILRDLMLGKKRFGEFQSSKEKIPTNLLASRLKKMVELGLVQKQAYQQKPPRFEYELTPKGADLLPVLQQLSHWSSRYNQDQCYALPDDFYQAQPQQMPMKPKG